MTTTDVSLSVFLFFPHRLPVYSPLHCESSPIPVQAQKGLHVVFTQLKVEHLKEKEELSNSELETNHGSLLTLHH